MRETEPGASGGLGRRQGEADRAGAGAPSSGYQDADGAGDPGGGAAPRPIPTPWAVKWERFSHGVLPLIVFLLALLATIYLWRRHTGLSSVVGEVDARAVAVTSTSAGTLTDIGKNRVSKYERVQQGEVVARLEVGAELQRRLALQQERERLHQALAGAAAPTTGPATGPATNPAEESLRAALAAADRELERLASTIQSSDIRAPITGRVTQVHLHPGQSVLPGQAILEIVEEQGSHIITFVRQDTGLRPTPGMPVEIHPRSGRQRSLGSHVETVGARIELVPEHQLADPKRPEWGLPVRIALPAASGLKPGELVGLAFKQAKGD